MFNISEISKGVGFLFEKTVANKIHYNHQWKGLDIKKLLLYKNGTPKVMFKLRKSIKKHLEKVFMLLKLGFIEKHARYYSTKKVEACWTNHFP
jgi:hypothetical protein